MLSTTIRGGDSMNTPLTPEQQRIAQAMQLNINRPIDEVLELLRGLSAFDQEMAARRKKAGVILGLSIAVAIVGVFFSMMTLAEGMKHTHPHLGLFYVV